MLVRSFVRSYKILTKQPMLLNARKRVDATDHLELNIDEESIKQVSKQKLLGIVIDENLSWTPQINNLFDFGI